MTIIVYYNNFALGLKNEFETAMVNESSVFEQLKVYCLQYTMRFCCCLAIIHYPDKNKTFNDTAYLLHTCLIYASLLQYSNMNGLSDHKRPEILYIPLSLVIFFPSGKFKTQPLVFLNPFFRFFEGLPSSSGYNGQLLTFYITFQYNKFDSVGM